MATRDRASKRERGAQARRFHGGVRGGDVRRRRRGIASLELVMALPVILTLMVALLTLGSAGTAMTSATIEARNDAWRARSEVSADDTALKLSRESTTNTLVSRTASKQGVSISPRISLAAANPQHTVMGGSWDHRMLPMDSPPHVELYARLGLDLASQFTDAEGAIDALKDLLTGAQMSQSEDFIKNLESLKDQKLQEASQMLTDALKGITSELTNLEKRLADLDPTELIKKFNIKKQIDNVKKKIEAIEKAFDAL